MREILTYLAAALPQLTSPAARLLALQCALRSDTHDRVQLPGGLLRGIRLHGRSELWEELEHTRWLRRTASTYPRAQAQLLDVTLSQQPGSRARARAAHWALRPTPLAAPTGRPAALQLTALTLASHTSGAAGNTDMNELARLCRHSPHQTAELLDRLTATRTTDHLAPQPRH
ncbi:hypothetical protein [Streptomyces europaeiscabiei]|uniref:hypothetical protein n=1 Tax=Streptomyces europaeiscabiei TaxID=146819 RepID=UPI0029B253C7|nr:hypothetical protein [Streptomyces europaeiscabiei]MDX2758384.1 hypothetical protein [Streptomyces europaeiscabiei]